MINSCSLMLYGSWCSLLKLCNRKTLIISTLENSPSLRPVQRSGFKMVKWSKRKQKQNYPEVLHLVCLPWACHVLRTVYCPQFGVNIWMRTRKRWKLLFHCSAGAEPRALHLVGRERLFRCGKAFGPLLSPEARHLWVLCLIQRCQLLGFVKLYFAKIARWENHFIQDFKKQVFLLWGIF